MELCSQEPPRRTPHQRRAAQSVSVNANGRPMFGVREQEVRRMGKTLLTAILGIGSAFVSALCCVGPLLAVTAGVSAAGLSATFEPLRPYFLGGTAAFLGLVFNWIVINFIISGLHSYA